MCLLLQYLLQSCSRGDVVNGGYGDKGDVTLNEFARNEFGMRIARRTFAPWLAVSAIMCAGRPHDAASPAHVCAWQGSAPRRLPARGLLTSALRGGAAPGRRAGNKEGVDIEWGPWDGW